MGLFEDLCKLILEVRTLQNRVFCLNTRPDILRRPELMRLNQVVAQLADSVSAAVLSEPSIEVLHRQLYGDKEVTTGVIKLLSFAH